MPAFAARMSMRPCSASDAVRHGLDGSPVGDVGRDRDASAPASGAPSPSTLRARRRCRRSRRARPRRRGRTRYRARSLRAAGHDCDLIGESLHGAPRSDAKYNRAPHAALPRERREVRLQPGARVDRHGGAGRALRGRVGRGLPTTSALLPTSRPSATRRRRRTNGPSPGRSPSPARGGAAPSR